MMKKFYKILTRTLTVSLILIVSLALLLVHARYIAPYDFGAKTTAIQSDQISDDADGLKILAFGDTHLGHYYTLAQFSLVVDAINAQHPDMVLFAGDLIDTFEDYGEDTAALSALLAKIEAPYGKYCVYGNHDYGGGAEEKYPGIMEDGGFQLLLNENSVIEDLQINIIGIDDVLIGYGDLAAAENSIPGYYNILLAHEPDIADEISANTVNFMVAGHTHGRQVNLKWLNFKWLDNYILPPYGRHYVEGLYRFSSPADMVLYVTPGIGTTLIPVRFNSKPELSVFILSAEAPPAV